MSAGSATALALVPLAGVAGGGHAVLVAVAVGWWLVGGWVGISVSRDSGTSKAIGSLLADARSQRSLPQVSPALTVVNRLWPLMVLTVAAAGIGIVEPQIPAIAAGFAIGWALAWRRQASAGQAIEGRDGARFYVDRTPPLSAIRLVRTPGFRTIPQQANGSEPAPAAQP